MGVEAEVPKGDSLRPSRILVEADLFISYLTSDNLEPHFRSIVERAKDFSLELFCSSEVYDDIATALRSEGVNASQCSKFLADTKLIPHESVPLTPEIASKALEIYSEFGGRRRLHYFDAFHVSTAKALNMTFYTSDKYVIHNCKKLGIKVVDVRSLA
ncbi:MAG: type II toxin-antitoxin system VapC family toxin [Nitrososphaerales archaeon]